MMVSVAEAHFLRAMNGYLQILTTQGFHGYQIFTCYINDMLTYRDRKLREIKKPYSDDDFLGKKRHIQAMVIN